MTLSELQTKRDALLSRMMAGVTRAGSGADSVEFQSISEMRRALDVLDKEIAAASGTSTTSKGRFIACDQ